MAINRKRTSSAAPKGGWSLPTAFGRGLTLTMVLAVLLTGGLATALVDRQAGEAADSQEADLAARISRTLDTTTHVLVAGLAGASVLAQADGTLNRDSFDSFAEAAAASTALTILAYEPIVSGSERASFERSIGTSIKQSSAEGLVPAPNRDTYLPVLWSHPESANSVDLAGFDISSDDVRAAAAERARDTGEVVFSPPVHTLPDGAIAFVVITALYRPGLPLATAAERRAAVVGYLSSAVAGSVVLDELTSQMPGGTRIRISDGGELLAATPDAPSRGHSAFVSGGGRPWRVTIDHRRPDHAPALLMAGGTVAVALLVGLFLARNRRQTNELRLAAESVRLLGRLSEHLATADSQDDVARVAGNHVAQTVGAASSSIALPAGPASAAPVLVGPLGRDVQVTSGPMLEAWDTDAAAYVGELGEYRRRYPTAPDPLVGRGRMAAAALPLHDPGGRLIGVLGFEWRRKQRFRPRLRTTLEATAELCQQSLVRAQMQEARRVSAATLSNLGQRLSVARTLDQVATEVARLAPQASGADLVLVGFVNEPGTQLRLMRTTDANAIGDGQFIEVPLDPAGPFLALLRRGEQVQFRNSGDIDRYPVLRAVVGSRVERLTCLPLADSVGTLGGVLAFVWLHDTPRHRDEPGRLVTIGDLTAQTVERAQLYQLQHELVEQLQRRTLPDLPTLAGLEVAARYRPSASSLGLGGDWYDVQVLADGSVGLVVGDVVGHGIDAIADMTEIRTIVSTLLRTGDELSSIPERSTVLLISDDPDAVLFATAVLMVVEPAAGVLRYVRAGHPPPLLRMPDGQVLILEDAGTTPIGIAGRAVSEARMALPPGALLVAYTDGLIERRGEHIDIGIARLHTALAACGGDIGVDAVAEALVEACLDDRPTEDDTALLVVRIPA
jgi:serine phosphatase RsbU (regulator of sigma subunit)/CHASE1-domain containing sensor protein